LTFGDDFDSSAVGKVQTKMAGTGPRDAMAAASPSVGVTCSSNKFASGANQNCGNVITDRPTTRLHQAPGGASTLSLGNDDVESSAAKTKAECAAGTHNNVVAGRPPAVETTSSNKFANGANQNCGNSITDRPTTRVHQAPGGASTVRLGCD